MPTRIIVSAVTPRSFVRAKSDKRRREGEDEGVDGDDERPCAGNERPAEGDGERGADARRRRDAEGERIGEGIAEDRLHAGAGKSQHGADQAGHRCDRQAQVPDDDVQSGIGPSGVEERRCHIAQAVAAGPDRKSRMSASTSAKAPAPTTANRRRAARR